MDIIDLVLPIIIFLPIIMGIIVYNIKDIKKIYIISLLVLMICTILSIFIFMNNNLECQLNIFMGICLKYNSFGVLYSIISSLLFMASVICSKDSVINDNGNVYYSSILIVFGSTLGIFLGYNLLTIFIFFETMSFSSYLWVSYNHDKESKYASDIYLGYTVIAGLIMLMGIFILYSISPVLNLDTLDTLLNTNNKDLLLVGITMLLIGFATKAGIFILHNWLPLAYTNSPSILSGLLSSILSKAGIYGILLISIRVMSYSKYYFIILLIFGILNMLVGAICAFGSNNFKSILAFSSMSQIGFIIWGIALICGLQEHQSIAAYGSLFHMINHSLVKALIYIIGAIIYKNTKSLNLNDIKGYGKNKPWLKIIFIIGALTLAGVPLLSGYVSKTLLHEAIVEYIHLEYANIFIIFEYLFLISGGFTLAYMLKLYVCIFVKDPIKETSNNNYVCNGTKLTLSIICIILIILGILPNILFMNIGHLTIDFFNIDKLHNISYFSITNLKGSFISISIGLLIYYISTKLFNTKQYYSLINEDITILNMIYKPTLNILSNIFAFTLRVFDIITDTIISFTKYILFRECKIPDSFFGNDKEVKHIRHKLNLSSTLSYSLLMFGIGFLFTVIYLIVVTIH